jgi:WD40 repeat protein
VKRNSSFGNGLAFSPDGRGLAVASDKLVRVWDVATGKERTPSFRPHTRDITSVAFTPDGKFLVAGAEQGSVLETPFSALSVVPPAGPIGLLGSPLGQGPWLASSAVFTYGTKPFETPTVLAWDVQTGKRVLALTHAAGVFAVAVSPDGQTIASIGFDFTIRVWDAKGRREKWTGPGAGQMYTSMAFSHDARWLLSGSVDGTIKVWDVRTGNLVRALRGHTLGISGIVLSADGRRLLSAGLDGTIRVWEWDRDQEALTFEEPLWAVESLAFHADRRHLASGSGVVRLWDLQTGRIVRSFNKDSRFNFFTSALAFSPNGKRLATGSVVVELWDTVNGKKLLGRDSSLVGGPNFDWERQEDDMVRALAFSPNGKQLAVGLASGTNIRDATTGKLVRAFAGGRDDETFAIAYSRDGKYLAFGGSRNVITLVDASTGEIVRTFSGFLDAVNNIAFSADGQRLLVASASTASIWKLHSGEEMFRLPLTSTFTPISPGLRGKACFSPDGQRLAMAPGDGTVQIWDMATGQPILSLAAPGTEVFCVAFSPDGHWLAAGGREGMTRGILRIWDARPVEDTIDNRQPASRVGGMRSR